MELNELSASQKEELMAQLEAEKKAKEQKRKNDIEAYKGLVGEAVERAFPKLLKSSAALAATKLEVYDLFDQVKAMKYELYSSKNVANQSSHTFINKEGNRRITLGCYMLDNYDDTAEEGIAMVNDYLDGLAENNPKAEQAVKICRSLMSRDKKGNLKAAKIVTLQRHANESGDPLFIRGVETIVNAYKPTESKRYVKAEYKNDIGTWVNIPLGMTESE